ncbi:MAG: hypothetical protein KUG77_13910, partial [Nannocystaceae bacterium]|nr:hypothetical protein [Nannocystaceae bacterium]
MMLRAAALWALLTAAPEPDLQTRIDRADVATHEGRWFDAAAEYGIVFQETGDLRVRYAQAEAMRYGGNCVEAIPMYEECVAGGKSASIKSLSAGKIDLCEEELAAARAREEALSAPVIAAAEPEHTAPADAPPRDPPSPSPWYRDRAGDGLVAVGLAASVAGGVVLALGQREGNASPQASNDRDFGTSLDRARTRTLAGGLTAGVGGALLLGGIVRWVVVHRQSQQLDLAIHPNGLLL